MLCTGGVHHEMFLLLLFGTNRQRTGHLFGRSLALPFSPAAAATTTITTIGSLSCHCNHNKTREFCLAFLEAACLVQVCVYSILQIMILPRVCINTFPLSLCLSVSTVPIVLFWVHSVVTFLLCERSISLSSFSPPPPIQRPEQHTHAHTHAHTRTLLFRLLLPLVTGKDL